MSRDDGFAVMDVSSDIINDPKVRKLYRHAPDHAGPAFIAYVATMGESWKAGRRVTVEDSWPPFLPFDQVAVDALGQVGLLDSKGLVPVKTWRGWFTPAQKRREVLRVRWQRANAKRLAESTNDSAATAMQPRGDSAVTGANHSVPSRPARRFPSETKEIPPPPAERGRRINGTNPRSRGQAPRDKAANPRSKGTSERQIRADQKRGPTETFAAVLRRAATAGPEPVDDDQPEAAKVRERYAAEQSKAGLQGLAELVGNMRPLVAREQEEVS